MYIRSLLFALSIMYSLTACDSQKKTLDNKTVAHIAQQALSIQEPMTVKELHGGLSGAKLFLVTSTTQTYVLRFSSSSTLDPCEIACLQIASDSMYGPHLFFVDPQQQYVIMEYIKPHAITDQDRFSKELYQSLGEALSKMHHGPNFPEHESIFKQTNNDVALLKKYPHLNTIMLRIKTMLPVIEEAVFAVATKAPCHNDLNPTNLMYTGSSFKIIDYEVSGQDDPYCDLATVIQFYCITPESEQELLRAYFKRPLTELEKARLYVMKQFVRIRYAIGLILATAPLDQPEIDVSSETYEEFVSRQNDKDLDLCRLAFHLFKLASSSFESEEMQQALTTIHANRN